MNLPEHQDNELLRLRSENERLTAEVQALRKALTIYADRQGWTSFVPDKYRGECWEFDWDGELGDAPWEMAVNGLNAVVSGNQQSNYNACNQCGHVPWSDIGGCDECGAPGLPMSGDDSKQCRECGGNMIESIALMPVYAGSPDFPGDTGLERGCTMSQVASTSVDLTNARKCEDCGWSVTAEKGLATNG